MFRLVHLPLSPFCRKIRLVLAEKKLGVELIEEAVWEKRLEFVRQNPAGKVPVLKFEKKSLSESSAIFEYLEESYPDPELLPEDAIDRAEARRIMYWFDDKFHHEVTSKLLYERVNKKLFRAGYPNSKVIKSGIKNFKFHIDYMDWLLENRKWLAGNTMTIADFTAAAHFSVLDYIGDVDWFRSESVKNWYVKIKSRPAFRSLLIDFLPGFIPSINYTDLDF